MSNWTHQVTVILDPAEFERELEKNKALMAQFVANGNWTQEAADYSNAQAEQNLVEARKGERIVWSRHKSLNAATKGVIVANEYPRVLSGSAQLEAI